MSGVNFGGTTMTDLCIGCRAITGAPRSASDLFPASDVAPPGMRWETFECSRCGITDVRLVMDR
jgi:hypothetical protein